MGSSHPIAVDVRVLAATNRDLGRRSQRNLPPGSLLSPERLSDPGAAAARARRRHPGPRRIPGRALRQESREELPPHQEATLKLLQAYDWPGNIRELQNVIERAVMLCEGETFCIDESWLQAKRPEPAVRPAPRCHSAAHPGPEREA